MLPGLMMDAPLTLTHFLHRAERLFPTREVVSRRPDGSLHRYTYADFHRRAARLANLLERLGVRRGDRVATLCWNHHQHLEAYFAVPCLGAVLHTLNVRLHPGELAYIARHAEDRVLIVDRSLLPLLDGFRAEVPSLEQVIVVADDGPTPEGTLDYETCLAGEPDTRRWPDVDERAGALLCYTSGTTGAPKGVLYSHRSTVLHTLMVGLEDTMGLGHRDVVLPVVPMFHANAWGTAHAAVGFGAKLVFAGRDASPAAVLDLIERERVTFAAAVPTVWLGVLAELDAHPGARDVRSVRRVAIGGAACPPSLIEGLGRHGMPVQTTWGMTETNPVATVCRPKVGLDTGDAAELALRAKQGYVVPFVEQRHVDDDGRKLAWDGVTMGELEVRGPWVAASYFRSPEGADRFTADGWFRTGDVVTIDPQGYIHITDRSKDVIKSGGEWISTQALENALMGHPAVLEAAVFAGLHEKWGERPLAAVVLRPGHTTTREQLAAHLTPDFPRWWLPDDYLFLPEIPRTSTGKFKKLELRARHGRHLIDGPAGGSGGG
ncbi:MAG: long-chain fatty acid--CoA ligase [Deltaproteobacteria bacterium]|nr:long-chain fatty acid--CoA ligase [Deltaproteobacteria bacterium]